MYNNHWEILWIKKENTKSYLISGKRLSIRIKKKNWGLYFLEQRNNANWRGTINELTAFKIQNASISFRVMQEHNWDIKTCIRQTVRPQALLGVPCSKSMIYIFGTWIFIAFSWTPISQINDDWYYCPYTCSNTTSSVSMEISFRRHHVPSNSLF